MAKESLSSMEVKGAEVAELFGITERWVRDLAREGIIPKTSANKYVLGDVLRAYLAHMREQIEQAKRTPVADLDVESTRLKKAQADKTEMEVALLSNELVRWDDVFPVLADMVSNFKVRTLAIPTKAASVLANCTEPAQIQAVLKKYVTEALNECSRYDPDKIIEKVVSRSGKSGGSTA